MQTNSLWEIRARATILAFENTTSTPRRLAIFKIRCKTYRNAFAHVAVTNISITLSYPNFRIYLYAYVEAIDLKQLHEQKHFKCCTYEYVMCEIGTISMDNDNNFVVLWALRTTNSAYQLTNSSASAHQAVSNIKLFCIDWKQLDEQKHCY